MRTSYSDLDITFTFDGISIQILNILFERFTRKIPSHSHGSNCYEIHYIPCGYGKLSAAGNEYDIIPNTLFITGPHIKHAQQPELRDPMQEFCIYLKIGSSARQKSASRLMDAFSRTAFWIGQDTQGMHDLMKRLFLELEHTYIGYQEQIRSLLSQILVAIIRNYEQHRDLNQKSARIPQVDHKSLIIEEYFLYEYQNLSLEELAGRLFLSPRQTQRLLQEYYGKTFHEKKLEARMSAACTLLEDNSRSISSIAQALRYSSPEQFSAAFKRQYQETPTEYRKNK